ncbi:DUF692 domain-containing protein [Gordonia desulfuricans]|uniref:DUF692 domain-containing protein n=1 Tax=Gordonia desulfuricans TaxID=89051 RepID=A0A7K3LPW7_9ACTN|nr:MULTISPECIES: DUF692 domain-containing protein [Gordonia]EMP14452.2 endonuclease [Gordonia sp. NB41Y]NDK90300.1 DUF692 domain-containing protein [Gordonia desulfuricans]WLP90743.1 DUF692 domain-containing protein [Gordonia sp. NB41Y]
MNTTPLITGIGVGWRPEIAAVHAGLPGLGFVEVIAESVPHFPTEAISDLGVPVIPHGIGLSLGGAEPVTPERIRVLADAAEQFGSPVVSEHIAFVRAGGVEAGHLLPVPRTRESLDVLTENIRRTQDGIPVPLAVENIATLFDWPDDEYSDAEFLTELVERTGVYLLVDVANVYACARNRGLDPVVELDRLPTDRIAYSHVAGGESDGHVYHDTHTAPVPPEVLELVARLSGTGRVPAFMLERDGRYPPARELLTELDSIADAAGMDRITTGSRWWEDAS